MSSPFSTFRKKVLNKKIKIAVVGLGYVGLPLALEFAKKGIYVLGIDVDKDRIASLKRRESYITDITTEELRRILAKKNFFASIDFRLVKECDCVIICVPTPLKRKYFPNISYIQNAVKSISKHVKNGALIVLESTTYPGTTTEVILPLMEKQGLKHGKDFYLCFSPERIDPGNKLYPVNKIPKVIGGITRQATEMTALVYRNIIDKVVPVSSSTTAEAVKLLENTFRLINIGLIDELAMMAKKMGIDIWEVIDAAKTKPFGFMPFYPGPGVGGHCIPKDPLYLYWKAKKFGFKSRLIKIASEIITFMPEYVVNRLSAVLRKNGKSLKQAKVLVIGVTYKKDIRDLRKSPSIDIIDHLQKRKCRVFYYDPIIPYLKFKNINLKSVSLDRKTLSSFDCVVIAADHTFLNYDFILRFSRLVFDTRNVYKGNNNNKIIRL